MKVLLGSHFFPPNHVGGAEAYTYALSRQLRARGHDARVICAEDWGQGTNWGPLVENSVYAGVPVRRLRWNWTLAPDPFVALYDNALVERLFGEYLREWRPDIVHVTSCYTLSASILRAAQRADVPTFLTLTDYWFLCPRVTLMKSDGSLCEGPQDALTCQECMAG